MMSTQQSNQSSTAAASLLNNTAIAIVAADEGSTSTATTPVALKKPILAIQANRILSPFKTAAGGALSRFPDATLANILAFLNHRELLASVSLVNKRLNELINSNKAQILEALRSCLYRATFATEITADDADSTTAPAKERIKPQWTLVHHPARATSPTVCGNSSNGKPILQALRAVLRFCDNTAENRIHQAKVVVVGPSGSGKTAILNQYSQLEFRPESSRSQAQSTARDSTKFRTHDLLAWEIGQGMRPLWRHFFNQARGIICVVDSSISADDSSYWDQIHAELTAVLQLESRLQRTPLLVVANKQDLRGRAMTPDQVASRLALAHLARQFLVVGCSAALSSSSSSSAHEDDDGDHVATDVALSLESGLEWLSGVILLTSANQIIID